VQLYIYFFPIDYWTQRGRLTWKPKSVVDFAVGKKNCYVWPNLLYFWLSHVTSVAPEILRWLSHISGNYTDAFRKRVILKMNWKECRWKWRWPILRYRECIGEVGGLSETGKNFRMVAFRAETRTMHLPNTSRVLCWDSNHALQNTSRILCRDSNHALPNTSRILCRDSNHLLPNTSRILCRDRTMHFQIQVAFCAETRTIYFQIQVVFCAEIEPCTSKYKSYFVPW
jgi:hypothetical protein